MRMCAILLSVLLIGCSSPNPKEPPSIRLYLQSEPMSLDTRLGGDRRSQVILRHLFEGLTRLGSKGIAELALARSYTISNDGTVYTFCLQKSFWSNSLPVTAHDFEWAWKTLIDPAFGSAYSNVFNVVKNVAKVRAHQCPLQEVGIRALNDYTLEVVLEHPCPYFLELTANPLFSPICRSCSTVDGDWASKTHPAYPSNGPYILKEHVIKSHIILERNPFYHRKDLPKTDSLHFSIIENPFTAQLLFDKGDIDWYGDPYGLTPIETIHALGPRMNTKPISALYWLLCNTEKTHLSSPKIRKALACAIDRTALCQYLKGGENPAYSVVPHQLSFIDTQPFPDGQPGVAKALFQEGLSELGLTQENFPTITLSYWSEPACKAIATIIKEHIEQALGIQVSLKAQDWATHMSNLMSGHFELTPSSWFPLAQDPMLNLGHFKNPEGTTSGTHWHNDACIELLTKAEKAESQVERRVYLEQAEKLIMQEMPIIPLYSLAYKYIRNPHVHGEILSSTGAMEFSCLQRDHT